MIEERQINILFENEDYVVVEKPSGVIVHPWKECADKVSLLHLLKKQTGKYIYPVHRLDRPVSGVMIFAYSAEAAEFLKQQWSSEKTQKIYIGLCKGNMSEAKFIDYPLWNQGKTKKQDARTNFWPLEKDEYVTLSLFKLTTGRYHQIRRHAGAMGNQLIGDTKYGKGNYNRYFRSNFGLSRLFLHCVGMEIELGSDGQRFISPFPEKLQKVLDHLKFNFSVDEKIFDFDINGLKAFSRLQKVEKDRDD